MQRLRDGRGFCTREVKAVQKSDWQVVFVATCSFAKADHTADQSKSFELPMPKVDLGPQEATSLQQKLDTIVGDAKSSDEGAKARQERFSYQPKARGEFFKRMPIEIKNALKNGDDLYIADDKGGNTCVESFDASMSSLRSDGRSQSRHVVSGEATAERR